MTEAAAAAEAPAKRAPPREMKALRSRRWLGRLPGPPGVAQTWSGAAAPAEPRVSRPLPPKLLPCTSPPGPAGPYRRGEPERRELWACERAVSLRTQGSSATGALAVGVRAQSSRCTGRSSAQLGSPSRRLKCRFRSGFSGGRRPLGEAHP